VSILCGAAIAWTPFKSTVRGLKKDHAVTADTVDATPTGLSGPGPPYTTLINNVRGTPRDIGGR